MVKREKEIKNWNELKLPKVLLGYSGRRLPGRSAMERGRAEGVDEDGEGKVIRSQLVQEVAACRKEKVSVHDGDKEAAQRPAVQSVMRSCSQIENEEEDESWREGDQMRTG